VKHYVEAGLTNRLTDSDDGANLQCKQESLGIIPEGKRRIYLPWPLLMDGLLA